jgi:RNA-directed DNA polymerase
MLFIFREFSQELMKSSIKTINLLDDGQILRKIIVHKGTYNKITSLDNLFTAWEEFRKGKRNKADVLQFELNLEDNIFKLFNELKVGAQREISYQQFRITDPKPRTINKSSVSDRLLHHAIYRHLQPLFDRTFIFDSYSCRKEKGTHKAFARTAKICRRVSKNYTGSCWALKCDIKKFFDSIDHQVLIELLERRIDDKLLVNLLKEIIKSFSVKPGKGMPLGNLTSQLFANVYMDPLDKFVKHKLKAKYYIRYADDFLLLGSESEELLGYFVEINDFLKSVLKLTLHPDKIILRKLNWGIDFVGYVALPHHTLPRRKTVKRIFQYLDKKIQSEPEKVNESLQSYVGYLKHVNAYKISCKLKKTVLDDI